MAYLNINSIRNKFSNIPHLLDNNLGIFAIAETKLDSLFPESQFILSRTRKPFQLDVTSRKSGLLVFVNNDTPSNLQSFHLPGDIQAIPLEINLKQRRLLVVSTHWPPDQSLDYLVWSISRWLDHYLKSYEDIDIMGDFNANESNPAMKAFLNQHKSKNIIKSKTCFKSQVGSCIDLIIISRHSLHQFFHVFETAISDHYL